MFVRVGLFSRQLLWRHVRQSAWNRLCLKRALRGGRFRHRLAQLRKTKIQNLQSPVACQPQVAAIQISLRGFLDRTIACIRAVQPEQRPTASLSVVVSPLRGHRERPPRTNPVSGQPSDCRPLSRDRTTFQEHSIPGTRLMPIVQQPYTDSQEFASAD